MVLPHIEILRSHKNEEDIYAAKQKDMQDTLLMKMRKPGTKQGTCYYF